MPRRFNRRTRFRRPGRRRRFRRRRRVMRRRRPVLDPERKALNQDILNVAVLSGGLVFSQNAAIDQGVDHDERIGRQVLTLSHMVSYTLVINATSLFPVEIKTALIHFKQPNGELLDLAQVWDEIGTLNAVLGHRNLDNALRFRIIWTKTHRLSLDKQTVTVHKFTPMRIRARFDNPVGIVGNLQSGALYYVAFSSTTVTGNAPTLSFVSRTRFVG